MSLYGSSDFRALNLAVMFLFHIFVKRKEKKTEMGTTSKICRCDFQGDEQRLDDPEKNDEYRTRSYVIRGMAQ